MSSSSSSSIQTNINSLKNKNSRLQNICQSSSSPILSNSNSIERVVGDKNNEFFQYNQRDININWISKWLLPTIAAIFIFYELIKFTRLNYIVNNDSQFVS